MESEKERMGNQILGLVFCLCFLPISYGISEKENTEAFCSTNACYSVLLKKVTFTDARNECSKRKGDLVTIHNKEEAGHIESLLWKFTNTATFTQPLKLWIGLQLKSCVHENQALKGFSWISDTQDAMEIQFSNWLMEPSKTCTKVRCVSMKLQMDSPDNYKWSDNPCSSKADGYICQFMFQGMCQRVALAGPGHVEYVTHFNFTSSSLDLFPSGSLASVSCGHNGEHKEPLLECQRQNETNVYLWQSSHLDKLGPFCASEELGCKYNNGGCEHGCVEHPQNKSFSCRCRDGYVLAHDLVSCVYPDHCQPNPCEQKCKNNQHGFECSCSSGFALAENQINCINVKQCHKGECEQRSHNGYKNEELESEYNTTTSSIKREREPQQTTQYSIIQNEDTPKVTRSTPMTSMKTASPRSSSANNKSNCNVVRLSSKLLLSILCVSAILYF